LPVYLEISRLHRTVTIVARGRIAAEEVRGLARQLADARIHSFAKVVDVASATAEGDLTPEQIAGVARLLKGDGSEKRGPLAFIIDPARDDGFARTYVKVTESDGPVSLFKSLQEARAWLLRIQHAPQPSAAPLADASVPSYTPWNDPHRRGVLLRGARQRAVTARLLAAV
jgi:hypothetical protein